MADTQSGKGDSARADILLHPIRFKIIVAVSGRKMTTQQIVADLGDVPQASVYRHIGRLVDAGHLMVSEELSARGVVEKVYSIPQGIDLTHQEMAAVSNEDHLRYFTSFITVLMGKFQSYLQHRKRDSGVRGHYHTEALYLTDDEFGHFVSAIRSIEGMALSNPPGAERRRRLIFSAIIPDDDSAEAR